MHLPVGVRCKFFIFISLFFSFISTSFAEQLIVEPDMGRAPLLHAIDGAQHNVDLVMYGFTDDAFADALIHEYRVGRDIRVLLQHFPYKSQDENKKIIAKLKNAGIKLTWPDGDFKLTHQKTLIVDAQKAVVMTFNLTRSTFKNERNFALVITDPVKVHEIQKVFDAGWQHDDVHVSQPDLIFSPNNSRDKILNFIRSARSDIRVYAENISDYDAVGALAEAARSGVHVMVLTTPPRQNEKPNKKLDYLRKAGVEVKFDYEYVIHAKVIMVDHQRALLGSINLTKASMDDNRELSVITDDVGVIRKLEETFVRDWGSETAQQRVDRDSPDFHTPVRGYKRYFSESVRRFYH